MKITGIEPTPSPNTMKLTLDEHLPGGKSGNYTRDNKEDAPMQIQQLFEVEGIKGVYHVADFIALEREPKAGWEQVLAEARKVFGGKGVETAEQPVAGGDHFGEIQIQVQTFKGIPMQLKLLTAEEEKRVGLPARFTEAAFAAAGEQENIVFERKWEERSARFGNDLEAIGNEVAEEIAAAYSQERLNQLVQWGDPNQKDPAERPEPLNVTKEMLEDPDWKNRFAALDQMDPGEEDLPVLDMALDDQKQSVRRLATTLIGMIETKATLPYLYKALKDKSVTVRRTAGDAFSDLGDPEAMEAMMESLQDKSKLVRWRAAMFLYEVGDKRAIAPLKEAIGDPEFEVDMQMKMALERIEGGEEAKGSVWKQMTESVRADRKEKDGMR
ncbi:conserved virulence factor C family protein [Salicibibacter kimchii]|uniref:Virulence factor n=1 Tax=Salicibibacter kimchii TaxID=2099786 RepID=A0A345BVE6_9BACI|nr:conserved virulence factor C family protein [Salicibibacter kimchii]AXF54927.1 virulence factor [Salicibibacter kimchii]